MNRSYKPQTVNQTRSNFQFLLRSMERERDPREKENKNDNFCKTMKMSMQDQVKMSESLCVRPFLPDKKETPNTHTDAVNSLIYKAKKYLSVTDSLLYHPEQCSDKTRRQSIQSARDLIDVIAGMEEDKLEQTRSTVAPDPPMVNLGNNKSLSCSYHFPNGSKDFDFSKKIENLYQQKMQLETLISHHQRANIKMYIQMNEGQSEEIEKYKSLLASLFEKYKHLQKIIHKQAQKSKALSIQLTEQQNDIKAQKPEMLKKTKQLQKTIKQLQLVISDQNQALAMALNELEQFKARQGEFKTREKQLQALVNEEKSKVISLLANNHRNAMGDKNRCRGQEPCMPASKQGDEGVYRMMLAQAQCLQLFLAK